MVIFIPLATAAVLVTALLFTGWWRTRQIARATELEQTAGPMLESWTERNPSPQELDWLTHLSGADRRVLLRHCIRLLTTLEPEAAGRLRGALHGSALLQPEIARLRHRSPIARGDACAILGRLGQADAVPLLLERLRDPDAWVRGRAMSALADLRAAEQFGAMIEAIEATADWGNLLAVMALVRMGPASLSQIGALLQRSSAPAMTKALLQITGRLGSAADPAAVRALANHPDPEVRVEAVRTLGSIPPDPTSVDTCLAAMDDTEWPVRALAAWSLGRLRDERVIPRLQRAMGDTAYWVRHHTAEAIAGMGEVGEQALRACLNDPNPFVQDMATQALFMLSVSQENAA
jgi:HEAT repeat protein